MRSAYKAGTSSLVQQTKNIGMMRGFVENIGAQTARLDNLISNPEFISRVGARGLDAPLREIKKSVSGAENERIVDAYMTELQNELNRLSSGNAQSIAQMSTESRDAWKKIYDGSLSIKQIKRLLDEANEFAYIRYNSAASALGAQSEAIRQGKATPDLLKQPEPLVDTSKTGGNKATPETTTMDLSTFSNAYRSKYPQKSEAQMLTDWAEYKKAFKIK